MLLRKSPARNAAERGAALARLGLVSVLWHDNQTGALNAVASSSESADREYFVLARPVGHALALACSCPDARPGYCKHAAAALEATKTQHLNKLSARPSWLQAAYSAAPAEPRSLSSAANKWRAQIKADEELLNGLGADGCRKLLLELFQSSGDPSCERAISEMFGGEGAQSESYQAMSATRLVDTKARLSIATIDQMRWCVLFLLHDLCNPTARAAVDTLRSPPKPPGIAPELEEAAIASTAEPGMVGLTMAPGGQIPAAVAQSDGVGVLPMVVEESGRASAPSGQTDSEGPATPSGQGKKRRSFSVEEPTAACDKRQRNSAETA
mmetsp:Transcript_17577/g.44585  ORF Transcript_17577/g.44585 Transcript_17577/m.44585 type:complete len:326 (+) Transcript_17577:87-1064(+)